MKTTFNGRVLLLNFSYEPLGTVGVARAMCLVFRDAVFVEEHDAERVLLSVSTVLSAERRPSARLRQRAASPPGGRHEAAAHSTCATGSRCQYCGVRKGAHELTLDHITPRAQDGHSTPENLVAACIMCNNRKGNRTPEQARMPLLTSQHKLRVGLDRVMLCHYAENRARSGASTSSPKRQ